MEVRLVIFFFQAEDGIRDSSVTGVQTCALPISFVYPGRRCHTLGARRNEGGAAMPFEMSRDEYHARYGLTLGDTLRLGDTNLYIRIERDYTSYGDEVLAGFCKTVRDGLMANSLLRRAREHDLLLTKDIIL